jgi:hypothetical protein
VNEHTPGFEALGLMACFVPPVIVVVVAMCFRKKLFYHSQQYVYPEDCLAYEIASRNAQNILINWNCWDGDIFTCMPVLFPVGTAKWSHQIYEFELANQIRLGRYRFYNSTDKNGGPTDPEYRNYAVYTLERAFPGCAVIDSKGNKDGLRSNLSKRTHMQQISIGGYFDETFNVLVDKTTGNQEAVAITTLLTPQMETLMLQHPEYDYGINGNLFYVVGNDARFEPFANTMPEVYTLFQASLPVMAEVQHTFPVQPNQPPQGENYPDYGASDSAATIAKSGAPIIGIAVGGTVLMVIVIFIFLAMTQMTKYG